MALVFRPGRLEFLRAPPICHFAVGPRFASRIKICGATPMKSWVKFAALPIIISLGIGYIYRSRPEGLPVWLGGETVIVVRATQVRKLVGPQRVKMRGVLAPVKQQDIVAPFAGKISEIRYKTGDAVRTGAIVAIIKSNALAQRGAELQATMSTARKETEVEEEQLRSVESFAAQMRALYERDLIARRELEEAQSAVDAARAQLDFVRAQLAQQEAMLAQLRTVQGLSRISAPFSGVVSRLLVKTGATVAESTPIVTVADVSTLSLAVRMVGLNASAIRAGLPAEVFNADLPGHTWSGTVVRIDEVKGAAIPSVEVEIHISAPTHLARGMTVEAAVVYENQPAVLWLPRSSVLSMKGKHFVYNVKGGKAWLREVTVGTEQGNEVEIKTGVADGDIIVNDPPANVESGHRVKPLISLESKSDK
jgi:RND family efflux transporter MFP subunit